MKLLARYSITGVIFGILMMAGSARSDVSQLPDNGDACFRKGEFECAVKFGEQAIEKAEGRKQKIEASIRLSKAWQALGHHSKALTALETILPDATTDRLTALYFNQIGNVYLSLGNVKAASTHLETAEDIATRAKDTAALASIFNNVGNLLGVQNQFSQAMAAYQQSKTLAEQALNAENSSELSELTANILINIARLKSNMRDSAAGDESDAARSYVMSLPDSFQKASNLISLSLLPSRRSDVRFRIDCLKEAERIGTSLNHLRILSYASGYAGEVYEQHRQWIDAGALTRQAIFYAQKYPELRYVWQWQLGRILKSAKDPDGARKAYQDAIATLNPIRSKLFRLYRGSKDTFNEKIKPVYLGLADLLLSENQLTQAYETMELLKTAEIQEFFQDECLVDRRMSVMQSSMLNEHTAVIYPMVFFDRTVLLVMFSDRMEQIVVPVDAGVLGDAVRRFRSDLQYSVHDRYREPAKQLYEWLFRPMEKRLTDRQIDTIVIAPDGVLRLIPFSALHDGKEFLIERYAVATVPALTLTEPRPERQQPLKILLEGLSAARQGFAPLPNVSGELSAIARVIQGKTLENETYTIHNVNQEFKTGDFPFVHFATHGVFGGTPNDTFLLTYNERLTMDDLERLIDVAKIRGNQVELLTLSACETALGDERAAFGLAGIAVKAGVNSAVASLWFVDDAATSELMTEFYQQIRAFNLSKAKAMQQAQKKLIQNPARRHPAYWAPFLLIGNWL